MEEHPVQPEALHGFVEPRIAVTVVARDRMAGVRRVDRI